MRFGLSRLLDASKAGQRGIELPTIHGVDPRNSVLRDVDDQIRWYDKNARRTMTMHFRLRGAQIVFAAAIPITQIPPAAVGWRIAAGGLGALIAIVQGFDAMHHYGDHYVAWRATCERMIRERKRFSAGADPYKGLDPSSPEALSLLATQIDAIEGEEQQRWQAGQLASSAKSSAQTK